MQRIVAIAAFGFGLLLLQLAAGQEKARRDTLVYSRSSNQWFEGPLASVTISGDGEWAAFASRQQGVHLIHLKPGEEDRQKLLAGLDKVEFAFFCGPDALARLGQRGSESGWFLRKGENIQLSSLPDDAVLYCSPDGTQFAYYKYRNPESGLFVGTPGNLSDFQLEGRVIAMAFAPDSSALYAVVFATSGKSSVVRITLRPLATKTIASNLDANSIPDRMAVSEDGRKLYLALASPGTPNNEARHQPNADRWLRIYEMDIATGARRVVVESPGQDCNNPQIAAGNLYWTRNLMETSVVVVPAEGGKAKEVAAGGQIPMWSPDGRRIGYTFGGFRMADWGLDLDDAVVSVDENGNRAAPPAIIVSGYHEDFPPAWSPDGKWIAFHSHRSKTPVPEYASAGSTDDIYLRRADDPSAPEMRLTDFGWETGAAYWSPDGQKLLFNSWVRGGEAGIDKAWILTMDPETGRALRAEMLPVSPQIRSASWLAWSPDGKEIAIEDNRGGGDRVLWAVHANGSDAVKIAEYKGTTYDGLDWTVDGKSIIISALAGDNLQLFAVPRSGGQPRQLTHDTGNLMHPRVSPDGRWIAATRIVQSKQLWRRPLS
jgi:Tol biopolymer transport system component